MNKQQILNKLKNLNLDKDKIIIISGAALVVQGITDQTEDIDIATSTEYFKTINWQAKIGAFGKITKIYDVFDISDNLYDKNAKVVLVNGFKFLNLKDILKIKKMLNRPKDQKIIKKLENILSAKKMT